MSLQKTSPETMGNSKPLSVGEEIKSIDVQDQSPNAVQIKVRKGLGQRALSKLGMDEVSLQGAGVVRANQAQRAQDIASQPNKSPAELGASPVEEERAAQLIENTRGDIKGYESSPHILGK